MNEEVQAAILLALGALALRLGLTDAHLAYIRPSMGPVLAVAGAVLVALGGVVLLAPGRRAAVDVSTAGGDHDHGGPSRVTWLLVAPILAIAVIVPRPLGAFAANRAAATRPAPTRADFGPLPAPAAPGAPVDLPLTQFVGRAVYDQGRSLRGAPVRLTGFVAPDRRGGGFLLTRWPRPALAGPRHLGRGDRNLAAGTAGPGGRPPTGPRRRHPDPDPRAGQPLPALKERRRCRAPA